MKFIKEFDWIHWCILGTMTLTTALIFLDSTILPVALPSIQRELQTSTITQKWIVNVYLLASSIFLIPCGKMGDIFGHRNMFLLGVLLFGISSMLCGFAHEAYWLVFMRFVQGFGAAFMTPAIFAIVIETFSPQTRGKAIGLQVAIGSIFLSIGPLIGGLFAEFLSWRWIFFVNIPLSLFAIIMALFFVPKSEKQEGRIDYFGALLLSGALFLIVYGLMELPLLGISNRIFWGSLFAGVFLLLILYAHAKKAKHPIIDFSLYRIKLFWSGNIIVFCCQFVLMMSVLWPIFYQKIMQLSPAEAGAFSLLSTIPVMIASPLAGHLLDRHGPKIPTLIGFASLFACFIYLLLTLQTLNVYVLIIGFLLFGIGIPFILTSTGVATVSSAPSNKRGMASGIYNTIRYFGASLGLAVLGSWFQLAQKGFLQRSPLTAQEKEFVYSVYEQIPSALAKFAQTPPIYQAKLWRSMQQAAIDGLNATSIPVFIVLLFGFYITYRFYPSKNELK